MRQYRSNVFVGAVAVLTSELAFDAIFCTARLGGTDHENPLTLAHTRGTIIGLLFGCSCCSTPELRMKHWRNNNSRTQTGLGDSVWHWLDSWTATLLRLNDIRFVYSCSAFCYTKHSHTDNWQHTTLWRRRLCTVAVTITHAYHTTYKHTQPLPERAQRRLHSSHIQPHPTPHTTYAHARRFRERESSSDRMSQAQPQRNANVFYVRVCTLRSANNNNNHSAYALRASQR